VQSAVRKALGRNDIWGVGLPMSETADTFVEHGQFMAAYKSDYVTSDGQLVIDDPEIRRRLVKAIEGYTAIYRKGCAPPDTVTWDSSANNTQFLAKKGGPNIQHHTLDPQCAQARAA
jgi:multiple sugar transport system substrate-binding protein